MFNTITIPVNSENKKLYFGKSNGEYNVIEQGEWIDDGKYSYSYIIVSPITNPDIYYIIYKSRSGSYYTDYYYDIEDMKELELFQVKRVEKIIYDWEGVRMKLTDIWKRTLKAAPDPVVALAEFRATSEGSAVWWAVPLLVRDVGEFDSVRGAVAMSTEELYASGGLDTAALWLLVPPYPTDPGAWSSVLSLAHRVLADGPGATPMKRLLVRAATLALIRALKESEIVSFDAANVIGGVLEEVLSFISPAERAEAQRDFADVLASLGEPGLRTFMHERANATLNTSACPVFTSADADSAYAVIQSELADATISGGDGLRASLAHVGASLRTFAESQAVGTKGLGAASVRVSTIIQ